MPTKYYNKKWKPVYICRDFRVALFEKSEVDLFAFNVSVFPAFLPGPCPRFTRPPVWPRAIHIHNHSPYEASFATILGAPISDIRLLKSEEYESVSSCGFQGVTKKITQLGEAGRVETAKTASSYSKTFSIRIAENLKKFLTQIAENC